MVNWTFAETDYLSSFSWKASETSENLFYPCYWINSWNLASLNKASLNVRMFPNWSLGTTFTLSDSPATELNEEITPVET